MKLIKRMKAYIIFFTVVAAVTCMVGFTNGPKDLKDYKTVTITGGNTVWGLANKYSKDARMDSVEFIDWVLDQNDVNERDLKIGQTLIIPVKK